MSRFIGFAFVLIDGATTVISALSCSSVFVLFTVSIVSSFMISVLSGIVRSILFPTYFWDQPMEAPTQISNNGNFPH